MRDLSGWMCLALPWAGPIVAVAAASLFSFPAAAQIPVGGRVVDDRGQPVSGAEVALVSYPDAAERAALELAGQADLEPAAIAATGVDGRFLLSAPEPGMWKVRVRARGYVPLELAVCPLFEAAELEDARLAPDVGLSVEVLDGRGLPRAGAVVVASVLEDHPAPLHGLPAAGARVAVTGVDGRAALPRRQGEKLRVWARAPGHLVAELTSASGGAALRLAAGCTRSVAVREPSGRPATGVFVYASSRVLGRTDEAGRLTIATPCDRGLSLTILSADGRQTEAEVRPLAQEGFARAVVAVLPRLPARVVGRVIEDGSRNPVANAYVWASGEPGDAVQSDARGGYAILLPPGTRSLLVAESAHHLPSFEETTPTPQGAGDAVGPTFVVGAAAKIAGMVLDERREPVAGALLWAPSGGRGGGGRYGMRSGWTRSDTAGRFGLRIASEWAQDIGVSHPDFTRARLGVPALSPHGTSSALEVILSRGLDAFGRVVDGSDQPIAGATVYLTALPAEASRSPWGANLDRHRGPFQQAARRAGPTATSDALGRFSFAHLAPGRFDMTAEAHGFAPETVLAIEIGAAGGATDLGTVALEPGTKLAGRVLDGKRRPIAEAAVRIEASRPGWISTARPGPIAPEETQAESDADGRFVIADLAAGERLEVSVWKSGYAAARLPGVEVPTAAPVEIVLASAARVSGRVVDREGKARAGAWVSLSAEVSSGPVIGGKAAPGQFAGSGQCDEDGRFIIEDLEPGTLTLSAGAEGYLPTRRPGIKLGEGAELAGIEVVLERGATVFGQVLAADGTPVADARVSVVGTDEGFFASAPWATADGDGAYRLTGVAPGRHSIAAERRGHLRVARELDVELGDNRLDLQLGRGTEVAGRVVDDKGLPVAGARVELGRAGTATSDTAGGFRIAGVAPGVYRLEGYKAGYARTVHDGEIRVEAAPVEGLELRLESGGAIRGRLLGLAPEELARVELVAYPVKDGDDDFVNGIVGQVDSRGEYRLEPVAAGDWRVTAQLSDGGGRREGRVTVAIEAGVAQLDLDFSGGLLLTGRVTRADRPVAGATVFVRGRDIASSGSGATNSLGAFRIHGLEAGTYDLTVDQREAGLGYLEQIVLAADREVDIELPISRVSGVLADALDGSAVADALVSLAPIGSEGDLGLPPERGVTSDSAGGFTLTDVAEGSHRLIARKAGYEPAERTVRVPSGAEVAGLRLVLRRSAGLLLEVHGPAGLAPARVQAALLDATSRAILAGLYATGENGRVHLSSAPSVPFRLLVTDGTAVGLLDIGAPPASLVEVRLAPASDLVATVPTLGDGDVPATLAITGSDGRPFVSFAPWTNEVQSSWTGTDGRFLVRGMPAGTWHLKVTAADGRTFEGAATTSSGGGRLRGGAQGADPMTLRPDFFTKGVR